MRIDCEVHAFRREARRTAPIIDGSLEQLEGAARACAITGLVLIQPAFLNGDPTELFAQAPGRSLQVPPPVVAQTPPLVEQDKRLLD
ncbi:hypothetical protein [Bradyrhizobium sp. sBnM-33]|uniref:hypothetical protein n=1 Tax=Bradyrhizobium sp. sBnM-33 TaxID=2831780 RepID=UPI001BCE7AE9|nr:hypothetical protein [Bradyrhizobium sp. sBnM-33]WOH52575.1 hypothetical protein RX328_10715 [Bradyrhizobium sp. sBnM-33]